MLEVLVMLRHARKRTAITDRENKLAHRLSVGELFRR